MAINDYEQMSLFVDGEPSEKDKSEEMIPALNFNFCNLFVEPLSEEHQESQNSMAILGDSLTVLKKMKDQSVQLIFADAPYNIGKNFGNNIDKWETVENYVENFSRYYMSNGVNCGLMSVCEFFLIRGQCI